MTRAARIWLALAWIGYVALPWYLVADFAG